MPWCQLGGVRSTAAGDESADQLEAGAVAAFRETGAKGPTVRASALDLDSL